MEQQQQPEDPPSQAVEILKSPLPVFNSALKLQGGNRIADIIKTQFNFDMENRVRSLCHDMMQSLHQTVNQHSRDIKGFLMMVEQANNRVSQVNLQLEREYKLKDVVQDLKGKIAMLEKNMAKDVKDAVDNHESVLLKVAGLTNLIRDVQKERNLFVNGLDRLRDEIKDFENIINEQKTVYDKNLLQTKKEVTKSLSNMDSTINEMQLDRMQLKAMVKNQNFHFTEIQKNLGVTIHRTEKLERVASTIPGIQMQISKTDTYLNFYLPMEIQTQIHNALQAGLQTAPTKMRLDAIEHSTRRVNHILERINSIGTEKEQPFVKEDYRILKLDMDSFSIHQQWEEEERQRIDREKQEALDRLTAKTPQQIFDGHLYEPNQIDKLSDKLMGVMTATVKKIVKGEVDANSNIVKLVQFYNDEFGASNKGSDDGSDSESDSDSEDSSSSSSDSSSSESDSKSSTDSVESSAKSQSVKKSKSVNKRSHSHFDTKRDKSEEIQMYSSGGEGSGSQDSHDTLELKQSRIRATKPPSAIEEITSSEESPKLKKRKRKPVTDQESQASEVPKERSRKPKKVKKAQSDEESAIESEEERTKRQKQKKQKFVESEESEKPKRKKIKKVKQPEVSSDDENQSADKLEKPKRKRDVIQRVSQTLQPFKDEFEQNEELLQHQNDREIKSQPKSKNSGSVQPSIDLKKDKKKKQSIKKSKDSSRSKYEDSSRRMDESRSKKKDKKKDKKNDKKDRSKEDILVYQQSSRNEFPSSDGLRKDKSSKVTSQQTSVSKEKKLKRDKSDKKGKKDKKEKKEKKDKKNKKEKAKLAETLDAVIREDTRDMKNTTFYSAAQSSGTGSRINQIRGTKAIFQKLQDQIDLCVTRAEFDKTNSDVPRLLAEVGIYKEKLRIYEQNFYESTTHNLVDENIAKIQGKIDFQFKDYKETKSRIQRLNESQIIELKNVMIDLAKQIHELNRKQQEADSEKLKIQHSRLPRDILYLSKDEITLRRELAISLEDTEDMKESLNKDLKRLRREHYNNLKDLEQIIQKFDVSAAQLKNVVERQGLNDQAMAAIFKVIKLDHSLLHQDEQDRQSIYLMGLTEPKKKLDEQLKHSIRVQSPTTANKNSQVTPMKGSFRNGSVDLDVGQIAKPEIHTRQMMEITTNVEKKLQPANVVALNRNCITHADGMHNELVIKAFKMACLNYEPSEVQFEHNMYQRADLIKAKGDLLQYCLGQLKHLDLSLIDQKLHLQSLNSRIVQQKQVEADYSMFDPKDFPPVPSTTHQTSREYPVDWLNQDSVESLQQIAQKYKERASYHQKNLSMTTRDVRQSHNLPISGSIQITKSNMNNHSPSGGAYTSRQLNSVFKANRNHQLRQTEGGIGALKAKHNQKERRHQDSLTMSQLEELSVDGNNCIQPFNEAQRMGLYTAGTPHHPNNINMSLQKRSQMRTQGENNIGNNPRKDNDSGAFSVVNDGVRSFHMVKNSGQSYQDHNNQILLSMSSNTPVILSPRGIQLQSPRIKEEALPKLKTNKAVKPQDQSLQSQKSTIMRSLATDDHTTKKGQNFKQGKREISIHQNISISVESTNQLIQESKDE